MTTFSTRLLVAYLFAIVSSAKADEITELKFPAAPRLATTQAELAELKATPKFAAVRDAAVKAADPLVGDAVALPEDSASWIFYYACPEDGTDLRMITLEEHECPKCQRRYSDAQTQAAYRCRMHYALENDALKLGWAYAYTQDEKYAKAVQRILLHLADEYDGYPLRLDRWGRRGILAPLGGRRYVQSLDEAVGVIRLAKAYDLTRDSSVWSDEQRKHVQEDFFRATATTLTVFNQGINNHQTWYNAGLMAIASVLEDRELVDRVLNKMGGFRYQLERSLGDDGLWYEGAMAYQNYALQAMVEIVDAGRRMGLALHEEPRFKKLLRSSLEVAYPNGSYPAINDSDPGSFRSFNWSYQWAWETYRQPVYAQAAAWGNPAKLAELLGPNAKPEWPLETRSLNLPDLGMTILRAGEGAAQTCVFFDYGQHGEGHGHFDKLNITLFSNGREWLFDTGRIGYTHQAYTTWVKHTVAHNTVVIDGDNQRPTTGKLDWLQTGNGWASCAGRCDSAYPGVSLRRQLFLSPKLLVDVYEVQADREVQIDWLAHAITSPVEPAEEIESKQAGSLGDGPGYQHLQDAQAWPAKQRSQWIFPAGKQALHVWLDGDANDELFTAVGIGHHPQQQAPLLMRRRRAKQAQFLAVYDLTGDGQFVQAIKFQPGETPLVAVTTAEGVRTIRFAEKGVVVE